MARNISSSLANPKTSVIQSRDLVAGLGGASRQLLATCLGLFEDGSIQQRLAERMEAVKSKFSSPKSGHQAEAADATSKSALALQARVNAWLEAPMSDDDLRVLLWVRLRETFGLKALTFCSLRAATTAADDLVATLLSSFQPSKFQEALSALGVKAQAAPNSLDSLARQTLSEMLVQVMESDDTQTRQALVADVRQRVSQLDPDARSHLLKAIGSKELNDEAIRTILITGGGLASLGTAVSVAGFSAYIVAAQASAFIPLVSGPALVSLVAVLSNPLTIVLATLGVGVVAARTANQKIHAAIATRAIALLALNGLNAGNAGLRTMMQSFARLPQLNNVGALRSEVLSRYLQDWSLVGKSRRHAIALRPEVARTMEQALTGQTGPDALICVMRSGDGALPDMAAMSALTLGELFYHLHMLDPNVLQAADFSRAPDLSDPLQFAGFSHALASLSADAQAGAMSNLKGYVAEQVVATQLIQRGHVVEFPATSNEPGWDLMVDGVKFQVKNAADLSLLSHHFERYDYPVLANAEVADMLAQAKDAGKLPEWADQVHFVEGYSQEGVLEITQGTLDAGDNLLHPSVPTFAVMFTALHELRRYNAGQTTATQALQEVIVNGSVRAGLAVAGNFAGVGIGLLVFGPAGALILGAALPILSRTQSRRVIDKADKLVRGEAYDIWNEQAYEAFQTLVNRLSDGLKDKAQRLKRLTPTGPDLAKDYVEWRINDELVSLREAWLRLEDIAETAESEFEQAAEDLLLWIGTSTLHPAVFQTELLAWVQIMDKQPTLADNAMEHAKSSKKSFLDGFTTGWKKGRDKFNR